MSRREFEPGSRVEYLRDGRWHLAIYAGKSPYDEDWHRVIGEHGHVVPVHKLGIRVPA